MLKQHFGSSRRGAAHGDLDLFDQCAWCADGTAIQTDGSFQSLYELQLGAPVFQCMAIGALEFDLSSWSTPLILSDVAALYKSFCFKDNGASTLLTLEAFPVQR